LIAGHSLPEPFDDLRVDPPPPEGNLFETGEHLSLAFLDALHEGRRLKKRFEGAGIEPRDAPAEQLDAQRPSLEVRPIDVRNLELAPRRWLQP
jgi:hypothetical protein